MVQLNTDCLIQILNKLQDKKSLHSCLLVNREWCHLAIPILWKKYLWQIDRKGSDMLLSWLPSSSKQLLHFNNIQLPSTNLSKPPLFNYVSFCEFPEHRFVMIIKKRVLKKCNGHINDTNRKNILEREIYKLFVSQCKNIKKLRWETSQALSTFPGASTCFSQLCTLAININVNSSALHEMAKFCKNLNALTIYNHTIYGKEDFSGLISLIDVQRNLKRVRLDYLDERIITHEELGKALARKGNTINNICLFLVCAIPPLFLTSLINLEKLSIHYQKMTNEFHRLSFFKEISALIEKNQGNVSYVHIDTNIASKDTGVLIQAISKNCPNIKYLCTYIEPEDFTYMKSLLLNCRCIRYLKLDSFYGLMGYYQNSDELLDILAEFSPKSLVSVRICNWKYTIDALE